MSLGNVSSGSKEKTYEPIENGTYPVTILNVAMNKQATSGAIYNEVEFEITEGNYQKRRVWDRFMTSNTSPKAIEVGRSRAEKLLKTVVGQEAASAVFNGEKEFDVIKGKQLLIDVATNGKYTNVKKYQSR